MKELVKEQIWLWLRKSHSGGSSYEGSSHKRGWISQEDLELFSKWDGVLSLYRQSQDPLVPIDDSVAPRQHLGPSLGSRSAVRSLMSSNVVNTAVVKHLRDDQPKLDG